MADNDRMMLNTEVCQDAIQMIRDRTDDDIGTTIMHLCLCLRLISDANDIPPAEAIEDFKQSFLSIVGTPTFDAVN